MKYEIPITNQKSFNDFGRTLIPEYCSDRATASFSVTSKIGSINFGLYSNFEDMIVIPANAQESQAMSST
ncbi:hypothetical protein OGATHE_005324 [Ogataea polymorpha]|uniref:Uncharacterized protein n=1 Tax=Ogataea polymorpha TaxID=460523 RepID=A0A9P8NWP4_9ASCO|nr:hypothetical protein OGATHE_005324 [Ogataea polymorpha]